MYIQLSLPYRDFDKVGIKGINLNNYGSDNVNLNFNYIVYRQTSSAKVELFSKTISVASTDSISLLRKSSNSSFNVFENLEKVLLEYLVEKGIETGTVEVL